MIKKFPNITDQKYLLNQVTDFLSVIKTYKVG